VSAENHLMACFLQQQGSKLVASSFLSDSQPARAASHRGGPDQPGERQLGANPSSATSYAVSAAELNSKQPSLSGLPISTQVHSESSHASRQCYCARQQHSCHSCTQSHPSQPAHPHTNDPATGQKNNPSSGGGQGAHHRPHDDRAAATDGCSWKNATETTHRSRPQQSP
jgi:hypothetical protein